MSITIHLEAREIAAAADADPEFLAQVISELYWRFDGRHAPSPRWLADFAKELDEQGREFFAHLAKAVEETTHKETTHAG